MSALVIGAGGFIGFSVAVALRRAGIKTYGVVRKLPAADDLTKNGIIPLIGDANDLETYKEALNEVAVVVDALSMVIDINKSIFKNTVDAAKKRKVELKYIYTSGLLVYGNQPSKVVDETAATLNEHLADRIKLEHSLLEKNEHVCVSVMRPGYVYGSNGRQINGYTSSYFKANEKGEVVLYGDPHKEWGWIHVLDLGEAYTAVVEAPAGAVRGQIFNVTDQTRLSYREMRLAFAKAAGIPATAPIVSEGIDWPPSDVSIVCSSKKLSACTGWKLKHDNLVDWLKSDFEAFKIFSKGGDVGPHVG